MPKYSITSPIATAISEMEGFTKPGTLAVVNNNPGNIRYWAGPGVDRMNQGYVVFPSVSEGWRALYKVVDDYIDGKYTGGVSPTLTQMFRVYSPAADANDPDHYAQFVSSRTGLDMVRSLKVQAGVQSGGGTPNPVPGMPSAGAGYEPGSGDGESYLPVGAYPGGIDEITDQTMEETIPWVIGGVLVLGLVLVVLGR